MLLYTTDVINTIQNSVYTFKTIFLNIKTFPIVYTQPVFKLYFGTDHLASIYLSSKNRLYGDRHIHDKDSDLQSYRSVNGRLDYEGMAFSWNQESHEEGEEHVVYSSLKYSQYPYINETQIPCGKFSQKYSDIIWRRNLSS